MLYYWALGCVLLVEREYHGTNHGIGGWVIGDDVKTSCSRWMTSRFISISISELQQYLSFPINAALGKTASTEVV